MTYNNSKITENEFQYYLATYKGRFLQTYTDFADTADFYASEITDVRCPPYRGNYRQGNPG